MSTRRNRDGYEATLRGLVIHSADAIPDSVEAYLKEVAAAPYAGDAQKQLLKDYRSLVDQVPEAYLGFCLSVLMERPGRKRSRPDWHERQEMGLRDFGLFFPPSHAHGPFLCLLRARPELGLRLVNAVVNAAVHGWVEDVRTPYLGRSGLTPLPVTIDFPSGSRELWGDAGVYSWFRSRGGGGPDMACSALMALEVWMEERMDAGTAADDLFRQVLADAECVSIAGVCVSVALAYPDECLAAALPFASSAAIWAMDIQRSALDRSPPLEIDPFGRHRHIFDLRRERNRRPQRSLDVRALAPRYLFTHGGELREAFAGAVARFSGEQLFRYAEQRDHPASGEQLEADAERYRAYGDPENFRGAQTPEGYQIWMEFPEHLQERAEATLAPIRERERWLAASLWAHKSLDEGKLADSVTLEEAVRIAKDLHRPNDFKEPHTIGAGMEHSRLEAVAGTAAAVATYALEWAVENGEIGWCRDVLLAAAGTPSPSGRASRRDAYPMHPKAYAALGLGALASGGKADDAVREALLQLAADPQLAVVSATFRSLRPAWELEPGLCWNALALALALCFNPAELREGEFEERDGAYTKWVQETVDTYRTSLHEGKLPGLPEVPNRKAADFMWDLAPCVLIGLPLESLMADHDGREKLIGLLEGLMDWTVAANAPERPGHFSPNTPYEWNDFFGKWAAAMSRHLTEEETQRYVLQPVKRQWPQAPQLTADLMAGYINDCLAFWAPPKQKYVEEWGAICDWSIGSEEIASWRSSDYFSHEIAEVVSQAVFVRHGHSMLKPEWENARCFTATIDRWVGAIGFHPTAFGHLLAFLSGPGWHLGPGQALDWMSRCVAASADPDALWSAPGNGTASAQLLQRMWESSESVLRSDPAMLRTYSRLVDGMVAAGIPMGSVLRQNLD